MARCSFWTSFFSKVAAVLTGLDVIQYFVLWGNRGLTVAVELMECNITRNRLRYQIIDSG